MVCRFSSAKAADATFAKENEVLICLQAKVDEQIPKVTLFLTWIVCCFANSSSSSNSSSNLLTYTLLCSLFLKKLMRVEAEFNTRPISTLFINLSQTSKMLDCPMFAGSADHECARQLQALADCAW